MDTKKEKAMKLGKIVKYNTFTTYVGNYSISLIFYEGSFYFCKRKDGRIVEFTDLFASSPLYEYVNKKETKT